MNPDGAGARGLGALPRLTFAVLVRLAGLFCGSRLLILLVARIADLGMFKGPFYTPAHSFIELFSRWDAGWYLGVATKGYSYDPGIPSNVAFYPLYPLVIWLMRWVVVDPTLAGYAASNAALFASCILLWKLAVFEFHSESVADRSVLFLLLAPGSYWFSMIYSESLFVLLLTACMYCARRRRWLWAAAAAYGLALTRTPGLFAALFVAMEALQEWRDDHARGVPAPANGWWCPAAAVVAPLLGHATYLVFLQWRFGDWQAQHKTLAAGWPETGLQDPWGNFRHQWRGMEPYMKWIAYPLLGAAVVFCAVCWRALRRWSYPALAGALVLLYVATTHYARFPRYLSVVVPLFLGAAWLGEKSRMVDVALLSASTALLVLLTAMMISGYLIN